MTFSDPLQWIIIAIIVVFVVYFLLRVFRTLDRVDRYLDDKERNQSDSPKRESL